MIPVPSGVRAWLAVGRSDMRRGMNGLALQVQEKKLGRDPVVSQFDCNRLREPLDAGRTLPAPSPHA
jgi:hypothetical protein